MVLRSNNNANTNGGVVYANANNDASNVNDNYGSRLNLNGYNARVSATNIFGVRPLPETAGVVPSKGGLTKRSETLNEVEHNERG